MLLLLFPHILTHASPWVAARAAAALGFLGSLPTLLSSSMEFARCPWKCASRAMDPGGERQEGSPSSQPLLCSSTKTVNWQLFHCLKGLFWNSHFPSLLSHSEMTHEEQWVMQKHWAIAVWSCCLLYQPNVIILEYFDFLSDNKIDNQLLWVFYDTHKKTTPTKLDHIIIFLPLFCLLLSHPFIYSPWV